MFPTLPHLDEAFFRAIPNTPGVYFMLGSAGEILYIGKAKRLRHRLRSYRRIRSGVFPERLVQLVEAIREIRWEECVSEEKALARENELLHAIRPPFNVADTEPETYLFVTVRKIRREGFYDFQLTTEPEIDGREAWVFGCYKDRLQTKRGFTALMRLIHSATFEGQRFFIPARLGGRRTVRSCTLRFPEEWVPLLFRFLRGDSLVFLRRLTEKMIENDRVPRFMGPALQDDIHRARLFYRLGPRTTLQMRRKNKLRMPVVSHDQMDDLIRRTLSILNPEHPLKSAKRPSASCRGGKRGSSSGALDRPRDSK